MKAAGPLRRKSRVRKKAASEKFGVVDMIKLNRIGNKLGLAGAVGVLLAIGMVANQMITEIEDRGRQRARRPIAAGGRHSLTAHIDLRKIQLAASAVRLARTPAEVEKTVADLQRYKASQAKELDAALATAQTRGYQGTSAEDQGLDGRLHRRRGRSRESAVTLLSQIDKRSADLGRMDQGRRGPARFAGHGEAGQPCSRSNVCCFRPMPR